MESIFFSVIIPTYNQASLLEKAVKSVLNQSFKNFEIIIVDNYSDDETQKIVESFQKANKQIDDTEEMLVQHKDRIDLMSRKFKEIIKSFALLRMTLKILDKDDEDENSGSSSAPVVPPSNKEE